MSNHPHHLASRLASSPDSGSDPRSAGAGTAAGTAAAAGVPLHAAHRGVRVFALAAVVALVLPGLSGCLSSSSSDDPAPEFDPELPGETGDPGSGETGVPVLPGETGGLPLDLRNPWSLDVDEAQSQILVAGTGDLMDPDDASGGVQAIRWTGSGAEIEFHSELLIDDSVGTAHGKSQHALFVGPERAYLLGYHDWQDNSLYAFDTTTGEFERDADDGALTAIAGLDRKNIATIARSPEGDVWVALADPANPRIKVIDPDDDDRIVATIDDFELSPNAIAFSANKAIVAVVAPDFSSAAHSVIDRQTYQLEDKGLDPDGSDLTVRATPGSEHFFRLARSQMEYVARYREQQPESREWRKGLPDGRDTESGDPNPQDLIFVDAERAYLLLLNEDRQWRVDPSAVSAGNFLLDNAALDLSGYRISDQPARAHAGLYIEALDLVFVSMQRWSQDGMTMNYGDAYIAAFDVSKPGAEQEVMLRRANANANANTNAGAGSSAAAAAVEGGGVGVVE
ncbi:hypothetical protein CKO15_09420 [Halorhodospira abdelmalekii]|uniref:hypothetical protein n=1 Tax=Halorhodospira abdelmalekii TaxID=421629 RepID=UPI001907C34D|nr:hypothetical protein [Halorhodospira abdelmalekii]MBK1735498.1 hypothetical protein [Halorhodospira abdelmalekii]